MINKFNRYLFVLTHQDYWALNWSMLLTNVEKGDINLNKANWMTFGKQATNLDGYYAEFREDTTLGINKPFAFKKYR